MNAELYAKPHYVYRCYDANDALLYVGCTYSPRRRMSQHKSRAPWFAEVARVRYVVFNNRTYAMCKEREAIVNERPLHNVFDHNRGPCRCSVCARVQEPTPPDPRIDPSWSAIARKRESLRLMVKDREAAS